MPIRSEIIMIELNKEELEFSKKALETKINDVSFITKNDLLDCLSPDERDEAIDDLEKSSALCWGAANRTLYAINEVISEIENEKIKNKIRTFVRVLNKINKGKIEYIDMEN